MPDKHTSTARKKQIEGSLYSQFKDQGADHVQARFVANRIAHALGEHALDFIARFTDRGWTVDELYWLDQLAREWRKKPFAVIDLQDALTEAGVSAQAARRLAMEPMLYVADDRSLIPENAKCMLTVGISSDQLAYLAGKRSDVFLTDRRIMDVWLTALARDGLDAFSNLHRLPKMFNLPTRFVAPIPATPRPPPVIETETGIDSQPEVPSPETPTQPERQTADGIQPKGPSPIQAPPKSATVSATDVAASLDDPETPPSADMESAALQPPKVPRFADTEKPKPLKLFKIRSSAPPAPIPERPDPEPEDRLDWSADAQYILKAVSAKWNDEDWAKFKAANPWVDSVTSNEAKVLDLLKGWLSLTRNAQGDNPRLRLLASILLDRNLPQESELRKLRIQLSVARRGRFTDAKLSAAKLEKKISKTEAGLTGLRGLLSVPVGVVYLRLYALRRILDFNRLTKHPEMLLIPFEQVVPQSGLPVRGLSIPPPAEAHLDVLEAKAHELRYRANELAAATGSDNAWRRKPYIQMLLEPTRGRFLKRLQTHLKRKRQAALAERGIDTRSSRPVRLVS